MRTIAVFCCIAALMLVAGCANPNPPDEVFNPVEPPRPTPTPVPVCPGQCPPDTPEVVPIP